MISNNKNILVLGSSGFIGFHIFKELNKEFDTFGSYLKNNKVLKGYNKQTFKINILNLIKTQEIVSKINPNIIINCIAISSPSQAEKNQNLAYKINVEGTQNIVKISKEIGAKLIHFSTDNIFDGKNPINKFYTEEDIPNPINYYGKTKLLSEKECQKLPNSIILRTSLVYGNILSNQHGNFFNDVIENCRNEIKTYAYINQYRTPTSVLDISRIVKKIINGKKDLQGGIYNLAGSKSVSRYEIATTICKVYNFNINLINKTKCNNLRMPRNLSLDSSKIMKLLKIRFISLRDGLIEIYKKNNKKK